jgi:hypothetical protein
MDGRKSLAWDLAIHEEALTKMRPPIESELSFLIDLAQSPRAVDRGPLGRCLKRGWCMKLPDSDDNLDPEQDHPVYAVTQKGLNVIAMASSGQIRIRKR